MINKQKIFLAALFILTGASFCWLFLKRSSNPEFKEINIKRNKFQVEIADSPAERKIGLSERKSICESCGMLFIFEKPGDYSFWMKDMRFPLDIIWILNNEIAYIAYNIPADSKESIQPSVSADKVIEVNAGIAEKYGLKIGDEISF